MRIRVVWSDFSAHMKTWYRSKGTMFWTIFFPVLLMFLFGAIFSDMDDVEITLHVQDLDDTDMSAGFIEALNQNGINVKRISPNDNISDYIADEGLRAALVIPDDFQDRIIASGSINISTITDVMGITNGAEIVSMLKSNENVTTNITLYLDPTQQSSNGIIIGIVSGVSGYYNAEITQGVYPGAHDTIKIKQESVVQDDFQFIDFFLPGIIGMSIMTSSVYGSIFRNTKYREDGILRKLTTTPLRRSEWIMAMMLFMTFTSLLSTSVILLVGVVFYDVGLILNPLFLVIIVAASFAFAGIGMIISRFVHEEETADSAGGAVTFPMMFLAGTFFPLETMPAYLQSFARFLPLYYVNEGLRDSMIYGDPTGAVINTLVILAIAAVFFGIGVVLTKWKE